MASRPGPSRKAGARLPFICRPVVPGAWPVKYFLDQLRVDAVLLPRIVALGDIDEDELAFAEEAEQLGGAAPLDIPPRLGELERRLTLAKLVAAWAKGPVLAPLVVGGPASTLALAGDSARLMDDMVTRGVGWEALDGLVPDQLDQYWQQSLEFLRIARQAWPDHLQEIGKMEPARRRDLLISAEAKRLTAQSTRSGDRGWDRPDRCRRPRNSCTRSPLPQGAVVLPGLDTDLDEEAWQSLGGTKGASGTIASPPASNHPQFAMHALLKRFGLGGATWKFWASRHRMAAKCWRPKPCGLPTPPRDGISGWRSAEIAPRNFAGMAKSRRDRSRQS